MRLPVRVAVLAAGCALIGCGATSTPLASRPGHRATATDPPLDAAGPARQPRRNIYAFTGRGALSASAQRAQALVYVPETMGNAVDVISQRSLRVIARYRVGAQPQHVTPSWDLQTLWVDNDQGNSLSPFDPRTGRPAGHAVAVRDPYNLYFTPDGRSAIVVAEALRRLDFRDPHTMRLRHSLAVRCSGVDHMDFSAAQRYAFASCEYDGTMLKIDLRRRRVVRRLRLHGGRASPQDVKLSPDGRVLYVADQLAGGLWEIEPRRFRTIGFLRTGAGTHGLYPSRNARYLFATNRAEGSVSVIRFSTRRMVRKWRIPGGGSPDMGGVSADGRVLWLSGRYNAEVYALSTRNGRLLARIRVGPGPHGLAVWPQPGRFSLGHTGNMR